MQFSRASVSNQQGYSYMQKKFQYQNKPPPRFRMLTSPMAQNDCENHQNQEILKKEFLLIIPPYI